MVMSNNNARCLVSVVWKHLVRAFPAHSRLAFEFGKEVAGDI